MKLLTLAACLLCLQGGSAQSEPYVAEVRTFAFHFCPLGHVRLHGELLSLSQNTALFSLLGTNYGGDGESNFALPATKPIYTVTGANLLQCMATQGVFPPRPE